MNKIKVAIICFLLFFCSQLSAENNILGEDSRSAQFNSTIQFLMQKSKLALDNGNYQLAGSTIERAIRIEGNNPWLWHNLAVVRVKQDECRNAIQLALKSNDISSKLQSGQIKNLQLNNWNLIHYCHLELGEQENAKKALKFVKKLSF